MGTLIRKEAISEELGVSLATVNNWIKTQVIPNPDLQGYYSIESFESIINKVKNSPARLSSRANRTLQSKKKICYLGITDKKRKKLLGDLTADFEAASAAIEDGVLALIFALLRSNGLIKKNWRINSRSKIDALLSNWITKSANKESVITLFSKYDIPNLDDDILGAFYQSIQTISRKSGNGSYYTPSELLAGITVDPDKTILDPCCGSGGILLNVLTKKHDTSKIFARDIDETALKICFVNLALFFNNKNINANILKQDITSNNADDLFSQAETFDRIITNPPWGSKFSKKQKDILAAAYPDLETAEVFSISLYNALRMLNRNGELFFFLPHAFLNVAAHKNIRKYVLGTVNKISIKLLGNAFKGVLSESILIHIEKGGNQKNIHLKNQNDEEYQISVRAITPPDFFISATSSDRDTAIIEKLYKTDYVTLQNETIFSLGIVTGDNKKHLLSKRLKNTEAIFRGKDIEKYILLQPQYFINFRPELYQQIAPVAYYRQKKIAYRFICDSLVCALDDNNSLFLNSANFFIPQTYPMETIAAFFNSDIYSFIFKKKYHSRKVLKSHLQSLPLPVLSNSTHKYINVLYNRVFNQNDGEKEYFQMEIDEIICKTFLIKKDQYLYIKGAV
jgi:type I restriction-modification system DNA methylase subunit